MSRTLITDELVRRGLPIPPPKLGPEHEAIVADYKQNPTDAKRDYILAMCERFILKFYDLLKIPGEFDDFYQAGIERALIALRDYKPGRGYFGRWLDVSMEGFARTYRGRLNRDTRMFVPSEFIEAEIDEDYVRAYGQYLSLEQDKDNDLDRGTIHELLDLLIIRFCTVPEVPICRYAVEYLKATSRYPSLKQVCDKFCKELDISVDDAYFSLNYIRVACHLHFLRYGKSLARKDTGRARRQ